MKRIFSPSGTIRLGDTRLTWPPSWPVLDAEAKRHLMQDTAWADGLRGIAAIFVVWSHLTLCIARELMPPCCADDNITPRLFQRPVLRLVASGSSWVAIFFILLGFVNALKPLKLARSGQADTACSKLAASALSRIFRLIFPAAAATVVSWVITQFGFYETGRQSDAFWLANNTPVASENIFVAVVDLKNALRDTWFLHRDNPYDQPQWALIYLLQGSMMVIIALLITVNMTLTWRTLCLVILAQWSLNWSHDYGDPFVGLCCFWGIILAEFGLTSIPNLLAQVSPYLSPPLAILALILMSYPPILVDSTPWSKALHYFAFNHLTPDATAAYERTYGSIGGILLIFSIIISPHARWALSRKSMQWLGRVSFAIYLLHGMVLRTVFAWVLFAGVEKVEFQQQISDDQVLKDWRYPLPGRFRKTLAVTVAFVVIFGVSQAWNAKVEPIFGKLTSKLEKTSKGQLFSGDLMDALGQASGEKETLLPVRQD